MPMRQKFGILGYQENGKRLCIDSYAILNNITMYKPRIFHMKIIDIFLKSYVDTIYSTRRGVFT